MKTTHRRIALFTGASVAALAASPAFAQHYPAPAPHDAVADGVYPGINVTDNTDPVAQTIVICNIAATPDCFLGEKQSGPGTQTAVVNSPANGQIELYGNAATGNLGLAVVNAAGQFAEIGAVALATAPVAGFADANAYLNTAVSVVGQGGDDVTVQFDNDGTMLIDALAVATGTNANASAALNYGIYEYGSSTGGAVALVFSNDGDMTVGATAIANGETRGYATAQLANGLNQNAYSFGGPGAINQAVNNGDLEVVAYASANATAGSATAYAYLSTAVSQYAYASAGGDARNYLENNGTMELHSIAIANGTDYAYASANNNDAINQSATAFGGGDASNDVVNTAGAVLDIGAIASANATGATGNAYAYAEVSSAIYQDATATDGRNASNGVLNDGTIAIHADAIANGATIAYANASNSYAISQDAYATGGGGAANAIVNNGTLSITADAVAVATDGSASASASVYRAINQSATAFDGGAASNLVSNGAGTLNIAANAVATGTSAYASAWNSNAIEQTAVAFGGGDATNTVTNGGTLNITAIASANATDGYASASASVSSAIDQFAQAAGGGDALNLLSNSGDITILASAVANGATGASAEASLNSGLYQFALAHGTGATPVGGNASAVIENDGTITIAAVASANGGTGGGNAEASNSSAVNQFAYAFDGGDALVSLTGTGTLNISATALVTGEDNADASAEVYEAISQYAYAETGDASVILAQGELNVQAIASASGGFADATAQNYYAIWQGASADNGGDALASITLGGGSIVASGRATSTDGSAEAYVTVYQAINQNAWAEEGGNATASLTNTGDLTIAAVASAVGTSSAFASAYNTSAIQQYAETFGGTLVGGVLVGGSAVAEFNNSGDIDIVAAALASGSSADAYASVSNAVAQSVFVAGVGGATVMGDASALIDNDGTLAINAIASAFATDGPAQATANNMDAIAQNVNAFDGGDAFASITGAGSIEVGAAARAVSTDNFASANAFVSDAIVQAAFAELGDATVVLAQAGGVNIHATALAGGSGAVASATVDGGIIQIAQAPEGDASITLALGGDSNITAFASVNATDETGTAFASVTNAILQIAVAGDGNDATINFSNTGTLTIGAGAVAVADETAFATALADGIQQIAIGVGGGDAVLDFTNAGTLAVVADATATGDSAFAYASVSYAVNQLAIAFGTAPDGGDAIVNLDNTGTILAAASAIANATAADASATAFANVGVAQTAIAVGGGDASASANNEGTIAVSAVAIADAGERLVGVGATQMLVLGDAYALASAGTALGQFAVGLNADVAATNAGTVSVAATASALDGGAFATALAFAGPGIAQLAVANPVATAFDTVVIPTTGGGFTTIVFATDAIVGDATASVDNSGLVSVGAAANATATGAAYALAVADGGIVQQAIADTIQLGDPTGPDPTTTVGGNALATVDNAGAVQVLAIANATAGSTATASAYADGGIRQFANAEAGTATGTVTNSGTVAVSASAAASGAFASAYASASDGIQQSVIGMVANANITNSGLVTVNADAVALGTTGASAFAAAGSGIHQFASGTTVEMAIVNSGTVALSANATAVATTGSANASAYAYDGLEQRGMGGDVTAVMDNSGVVSLVANASASAATAASAFAGAYTAMYQVVIADTAFASMTNSGSVTASANAFAAGTSAVAGASAFGMGQIVAADTGTATMVNSGSLVVNANASASGTTYAAASAYATGAYQTVNTGALNFTNSGVIEVQAGAFATADTGSAFASAIGYNGFAFGQEDLDVAIVNSGTLNVFATAVAPGTATANALGMVIENAPTPTLAGFDANPIDGTLLNSGTIRVVASASGGVTSEANATGIMIMGGANDMVVTNTGAIRVDAITNNGGEATANGVVVLANGDVDAADADAATFTFTNNGGTIVVRESVNGGTTWRRGMAIDVSAAPNDSIINLLGNGSIYGNIDVQEGDAIFVGGGTTRLDGIINPECIPAGGRTALQYDNAALSACGQGTLTIGAGGNLILASPSPASNMFDGPAYVFVDTFTMTDTGTITFELRPTAGGNQPIGSYPQIYADVANLDGTLVAAFQNAPSIFANSYFWNNVIDANTRNGTFDECIITGINTASPLLNFSGCIYDNANNVDLGLTRVAFDAVAGLTPNQGAVAGGIECLYDDLGPAGLTGTPFGNNVVAQLFLFDAAEYPQALEQLTGASYASYLQSFNTLGYHYNQILDRATDCEVPALAGSALACRVAPMHLWGQVDYDTLDKDGDENLAGGYDADRWSFLVGFDVSVSPAAVIGASIGKVSNKVEHDWNNARIKGDGWQFGLYGTYDPGQFYVKALGTYTNMDGDARRDIDFTPFGGTLNGRLNGDPDTRMLTFGLHGGFRIPMGETSVITPFVNYDYTDVKLKGFTETGLAGPELTVTGGREKHSWLTGGVKFAAQMGGLVPELKLGYRHMFGDRTASFNAAFMGDEDCDFDIVSMTEKRGAILAGLSVGGKLGMVDVRVGYDGAFNSDMQQHSGFLKLVVPLGAVAVPPPPPVVVAPPPPPAPATQVCPDGSVILATDICPAPPPPPPPPAPAPERG